MTDSRCVSPCLRRRGAGDRGGDDRFAAVPHGAARVLGVGAAHAGREAFAGARAGAGHGRGEHAAGISPRRPRGVPAAVRRRDRRAGRRSRHALLLTRDNPRQQQRVESLRPIARRQGGPASPRDRAAARRRPGGGHERGQRRGRSADAEGPGAGGGDVRRGIRAARAAPRTPLRRRAVVGGGGDRRGRAPPGPDVRRCRDGARRPPAAKGAGRREGARVGVPGAASRSSGTTCATRSPRCWSRRRCCCRSERI